MPILTAGYGNRGFDGFVALMKRHGVTHVVDVRSVPQSSYWEDFRRPRLERILPETGLRYVYMGDTLGGVREPSSMQNEALGIAAPERGAAAQCYADWPSKKHHVSFPNLAYIGVLLRPQPKHGSVS